MAPVALHMGLQGRTQFLAMSAGSPNLPEALWVSQGVSVLPGGIEGWGNKHLDFALGLSAGAPLTCREEPGLPPAALSRKLGAASDGSWVGLCPPPLPRGRAGLGWARRQALPPPPPCAQAMGLVCTLASPEGLEDL